MPQQNLYEILTRYSEVGWVKKADHPEFPELSLFCYTQETEFKRYWDPYTVMARGLVVHRDGLIVSDVMPKFWNDVEYTQPPHGTFRVYPKYDGSMVVLAFYQGQPIWSTKGSFVSSQAVAARDWLEATHGYAWADRSHTYTFEWIAPENKITVEYGDRRELILIAERVSGLELWPEKSAYPGTKALSMAGHVPTDFETLHHLISDDEEGFVLLYERGERVKLKGTEWLRRHRLRWGLSARRVWELLSQTPEEYARYRVMLDEECLPWFDNVAYRLTQQFEKTMYEAKRCVALLQLGGERKDAIATLMSVATDEIPLPLLILLFDENWKQADDFVWKKLKPGHEPFVASRQLSEQPVVG